MAPPLPLPALLSRRQCHLRPDGGPAFLPTTLTRRIQGTPAFVPSLRLHQRLLKHTGCVNTVSWAEDGSVLVSGSDDCDLNLWRWESNLSHIHQLASGHVGNIFCAKFVPCTSNNLIVSCALDGQVRWTDVQRQTMHAIARYPQRVHKVAFLPQRPTLFLTAGSDGTVRLFDLRCDASRRVRRNDPTNIVFDLRCTLKRQSIDISAVSVHPLHGHLMALCGGDEFVRVADLRMAGVMASPFGSTCVARFCPEHFLHGNRSPLLSSPHITGCQYDVFGRRIVATYSADDIYIFDAEGVKPALSLNQRSNTLFDMHGRGPVPRRSEDPPTNEEEDDHIERVSRFWMALHADDPDDTVGDDFEARKEEGKKSSPVLRVLSGHRNEETVKEVTFYGVDSEFVASGSDCGNIFIWDSRTGEVVTVLRNADSRTINCIAPNPHDPTVVATCGIDDDIKVWKPDGMQGPQIREDKIQKLISINRRRSERQMPRFSARQILQLFLLRSSNGPEAFRLLGGDRLQGLFDGSDEEAEEEEGEEDAMETIMMDDDPEDSG